MNTIVTRNWKKESNNSRNLRLLLKQLDWEKCYTNLLSNRMGRKNHTDSNDQKIDIFTEFGNAQKQHNNTIKTNLGSNDAYNVDVIEKINRELNKIINMNKNDKQTVYSHKMSY